MRACDWCFLSIAGHCWECFFPSIENLCGCLNRVYLIELCRWPSPKGARKNEDVGCFVQIDAM